MRTKSTLFIILALTVVSALTLRDYLLTTDLDGLSVLSIGFADLNLQYTVNTGINFGVAGEGTQSRQLLLASLAFLICGIVIWWAIKASQRRTSIIAGLFAGGGIANAIERIAFGGVFDYLNVPLFFYDNPYSFNVADIYIFLGAILYVFGSSRQ